jgi:hypothetical protein
MMRFLVIVLLLTIFSCGEQKTTPIAPATQETQDSLAINTPDTAQQLIQLSPDFLNENQINEWSDFIKFKNAIEDMTQLNPAGIMTFLSELYKITSEMLKAPFPEAFDKISIYSRIKVVQTQIIKCHYYASNNQNQPLNSALDKLYQEYNILLRRMIALAEENKIQLDSIGLNFAPSQDSNTKLDFSRE